MTSVDSRPGVSAAPPPVAADRIAGLRRMKRLATSLLLAMTVVFVVARLLEDEAGWIGYVRATAEAGMVGALADWFAVTALFRHPLGIPIPHTAIIPTRKDEIGRGLGAFVQGNFLSAEVIAEKVRNAGVACQVGEWLADPVNATKLGESAGDVVRAGSEFLRDDEIQDAIESQLWARVRAIPAAPTAGRVLDVALEGGHHQQLLDTLLAAAEQIMERNRLVFRAKLGSQSPWWVPESVDDRVFAKIYSGVQSLLHEVAGDPHHPLRHDLDVRLRDLSHDLRHSPTMALRADELREELLAHPEAWEWSSSIWAELKASLIDAAGDPSSELRQRLHTGTIRLGQTLQHDQALAAKLDGWVERAVVYLVDHYREDIAHLISGTIERWDADDTSRRIEEQVGRDLQFIRINGTVVGALAGLGLHIASQFLG
jgi:uncharacterized membrane-anchored protein YjiN (DUF445 family)